MKRQYKTDTPFNTINRIREILTRLNCPVYEKFWANPYKSIYSTRVETGFENGNFGTNGKGRNQIFCLASAYAEFIERLQNGLVTAACSIPRLFLNNIKEKTGFYYFPDEKMIQKHEFDNLPESILTDFFNEKNLNESSGQLFARLKKNGYNGCLAVPFYDAGKKRNIYIPYNLLLELTGSNGMAAGNSPEEAIFQGISEIFERYAAYRVYNEELTPPAVPIEYLQNFEEEMQIINSIEADGNLKVIVKDFSTDEKLPVIGVIIIDLKRNYYRLNAGSDSSFRIALSRCLTEIYQGRERDVFYDDMLPIPLERFDYFIKTDKESNTRKNDEFIKFTTDGSGIFPPGLFGQNESYPFDTSAFKTYETYKEENKHFAEKILNLGYELYIRDVSFLGFPSFLIYIPKLSFLGKKEINHGGNLDINKIIDSDKIEDLFFPFNRNNEDKLYELAVNIEKNHLPESHMKEILKLEFSPDSHWNSMPSCFFLTILWYKLGNIDNSIKNLKSFMAISGNADDYYYECVLAFLNLKKQYVNEPGLISSKLLDTGYEKEIVDDILDSFSDSDNLFKHIQIPNCPHCMECNLNEECLTSSKISFTERINMELIKGRISQENIASAISLPVNLNKTNIPGSM